MPPVELCDDLVPVSLTILSIQAIRRSTVKLFINGCRRNFVFSPVSEPAERVMLTGRHWVRDVYCKKCEEKLGWMYEFAMEEQQRYKESRVILVLYTIL